jgi:F-type H+-transporting ATPase subunit delta
MAEVAAIARPYAQAAFELAQQAGQLDAWSDALQAAAAVAADGQVTALLSAPGTDPAQLVQLFTDVVRQVVPAAPQHELTNLLRLLEENGRLPALPAIAAAFDALKAETENRVEVTLLAASPVDDAQQARIIEALKKRFGRDVSLTFELDPTLIGGALLKADDLVIDGTVRAGLNRLATTLTN